MAKGKKEKLSLEELLEEAIVKEEERPYEVPGNWAWGKIKSMGEVVTGTTPSKNNEDYYGKEYPFFKPTDLEQGYKVYEAREYLSQLGIDKGRFVPKFSTFVTCIGATIGKSGFSRVDGSTNQQINVIVPYRGVSNEYVFWLINSPFMQESIISNASSTTLPILNKSRFEELFTPIPPFAEQQRIVEVIESLFEKLDAAKELVQNALDSFENRKAAILHKAFTGELTAKWREENGVSLEEWEEKRFSDVARVKSNLVNPKDYLSFPHIAPDNIEKRTGRLLEYRTIEQDKVKSDKHRFYSGQILYSKIRPYLSKAVIIDFDGLCSADMYPIETDLNIRFLWYYMLSDDFVMYASSAGSRSVLPKINKKELAEIPVVVPKLIEQNEIVNVLDKLLENEQRAKELSDVIEKINLMKKTILAKAFRGELGTNNPEEESALGLLKEVLKEKI